MYIHYTYTYIGWEVMSLSLQNPYYIEWVGHAGGGARTHALPVLPWVGGRSLSGDAPSPAL